MDFQFLLNWEEPLWRLVLPAVGRWAESPASTTPLLTRQSNPISPGSQDNFHFGKLFMLSNYSSFSFLLQVPYNLLTKFYLLQVPPWVVNPPWIILRNPLNQMTPTSFESHKPSFMSMTTWHTSSVVGNSYLCSCHYLIYLTLFSPWRKRGGL